MSEAPAARLKRLLLSSIDLRQATDFGGRILELLSGGAHEDDAILVALSMAAVVSYCRPFTKSRGTDDIASGHVRELLNSLSTTESDDHDAIEEMRSSVYAHSDARVRSLNAFVSDVVAGGKKLRTVNPSWREPVVTLRPPDVEKLLALADKLKQAADAEARRLAEQFEDGDVL